MSDAEGGQGAYREEIARMEQEMDSLQRDFKAFEETHGENVLNLTQIRRYLAKLLTNAKFVRFHSAQHRDMLSELEAVAAIESL